MNQTVPEGGGSLHAVLVSFVLLLGLEAFGTGVTFISGIFLRILRPHVTLTSFTVQCRGQMCAAMAAKIMKIRVGNNRSA